MYIRHLFTSIQERVIAVFVIILRYANSNINDPLHNKPSKVDRSYVLKDVMHLFITALYIGAIGFCRYYFV